MASVIEKDGEKYYSSNQLMSHGCMINIICGTRAAGKSYDIKRHILHHLITHKESNFLFIVKDIQDKNTKRVRTYWNDICSPTGKYPDFQMERKGDEYYLKNNNTGDKRLCGLIVSLKEADKIKSSVFTCDMALLEEFINTKGKYDKTPDDPDLEVSNLLSLISTFFRGVNNKFNEKGKVFLVSNAYSINNPYFRYWGFVEQIAANPFKMFYFNKKQSVVLERTDIADVDYKMSKGNTTSANKWTDFSNELKLTKVKNSKPVLQMSFDGDNWISMGFYKDVPFIFEDKLSENKQVMKYSCSEYKRRGIFSIDYYKKTEIYKRLKLQYDLNNIYYDKLKSYITLKNIFDF